jgi:hypothetical protein
MKRILHCAAVLLASLIIGAGTAVWSLTGLSDARSVKNGPWMTNLDIGTRQTNMFVRAMIARFGLFALKKSEAVYFVAYRDSNGETLNSRCDYRITGGDFPARWWNLTVYGSDYHLIPNAGNRYSYFGGTIPRDGSGRWAIALSASPKKGNWLPAGDNKVLFLNLRLYRPGRAVYERPDKIPMPLVTREACR